ncbi:GNAT family N-acetyltransferase [Clostridium grantii]|nr:GNAT family N-acetyltransferase [Clostridium grantii]
MSNHSIIAGIALPNNKSMALHEKIGFRKVAHFEEIGYK